MEIIDFHAHIYPEKIADKAGQKSRYFTICYPAGRNKARTGKKHQPVHT